MKTDLKTNSYHNGNSEVWSSPPLSPTTLPYCDDDKENSANLYNLTEDSTQNNMLYKQKDFTRNEKIYPDHHKKMTEIYKNNGFKTEHCITPLQKALDMILINHPDNKPTNNYNDNKSTTQLIVEKKTALENQDTTPQNCSGLCNNNNTSKNTMATTKELNGPNGSVNINNNNKGQQKGDSRLFNQLIEEAVRNFSWDSGYVHEKHHPGMMKPYNTQNRCPLVGYQLSPPPRRDYFNYQTCMPTNTFNPHHRGPQCPQFYAGCESLVRPTCPLPIRRIPGYLAHSIAVRVNSQTLFERTHWFSADIKKPKIYQITPKEKYTTIKTITPRFPDKLFPSTSDSSNPEKKPCGHGVKQPFTHEETPKTPDTKIQSPENVAPTIPGDLTVSVCHMPELPQERHEPESAEYDSDDSDISVMEIVTCHASSGEDETSSDDDHEEEDGRRQRLYRHHRRSLSNSPRKYVRSIDSDYDTDTESDSDSDDSDNLECDGAGPCEDSVDDIDEGQGCGTTAGSRVSFANSFFISPTDSDSDDLVVDAGKGCQDSVLTSFCIIPNSDSECNDNDDCFDDDDDWETCWSSSIPAADPDVLQHQDTISDFVPELTCCTFKISCGEEKGAAAAVSAVDKVDASNLQRLKEANERWNKVYGDEDFTAQEEKHHKKVQFASGKKLSSTHVLVCWNYAYRAARKGPWIRLRIDSERFRNRINMLKTTIDPILDPIHRHNILTSRFQQAADEIA